MSRQDVLKIARDIRDRLKEDQATRQGFTRQQEIEELRRAAQHLAADAYEAMILWASEKVDEEDTKPSPQPLQKNLPFFDLMGSYVTEPNKRVAKKYATIDQADESLQIDRTNLHRVQRSVERKIDEIDVLRPYWGPGVAKHQAVEAYKAANPGQQAG